MHTDKSFICVHPRPPAAYKFFSENPGFGRALSVGSLSNRINRLLNRLVNLEIDDSA